MKIKKTKPPGRRGRPSLAETRKTEILDAFESCVARYGLEGCSMEQVAKSAGMQRSILRHFVGNREQLVQALARRVADKYLTEARTAFAAIPEKARIRSLLGILFPSRPADTAQSLLVAESLIAAGEKSPPIRRLMTGYVNELVTLTQVQLRLEYPQATAARCWTVAYGIISISFNHASLLPLKLPEKYFKAARSSAQMMIESLARN